MEKNKLFVSLDMVFDEGTYPYENCEVGVPGQDAQTAQDLVFTRPMMELIEDRWSDVVHLPAADVVDGNIASLEVEHTVTGDVVDMRTEPAAPVKETKPILCNTLDRKTLSDRNDDVSMQSY